MYNAPRIPNLSIGFMPSGGSATAQHFKEEEEKKKHPNYSELNESTGIITEYTWNSSKQAYDVRTYPQGVKVLDTIKTPAENVSNVNPVGYNVEDKPDVENPDIVDSQTNTGIDEAYNKSLAGLPGYDENKNLVENIIGTGESALEGVDDMANLLTGKDSLLGSLGTLIQNMINDPETYWDYFRNGKANEYNYKINQETNAANLQIAQDTNATNKAVADENLGFQRELQEYNKALQNRIFEREDTSYQRTAQDMISAGLNPLSMQGTNGVGEVIAQSPLHNDFQAQQSNPMQSFQYQAGGLQTVLSTFASLAQSVESIFTGRRQRDLLQEQIDQQRLDNTIKGIRAGIPSYLSKQPNTPLAFSYGSDSYKNKYESDISRLNNYNLEREWNHKNDVGIYDTDTREERLLTALDDWLNNGRLEKLIEKSLDTMTDSGQKLLKQLNILK